MNKRLIKSLPFIKWLRWYICRKRVLSKNRGKHIEIHDGAIVSEDSVLIGYNILYPSAFLGKSFLGRFVYIDSNTIINHTQIGSFCSIGPGCRIGLFKHPSHFVSTFPAFFSLYKQCGMTFADKFCYEEQEEVIIGNDVWVGANVLIADGVKVGDGAIIAAGAVVTKDVAPYSIVGGVPAKSINMRFSADQIEKLLEFQWWEKDLEWIQKNWEMFNDPATFFKRIG